MRRLLALVGAVVFVDTMFFAALTPLLPHYADRFELSKIGAGLLAGAYPAGAFVGGVPSGIAAVRFGARNTALAGLLVLAATTLLFGFADSIYLLDGARFVQGFASALAWTAGLGWLVGTAPPERRGGLIGTAMAFAIIGALFGPVLGGFASLVGTRLGFGIVAAFELALAGYALTVAAPARAERQPARLLLRSLRDARIGAGVCFVTLPALLFGTLTVLTPLRLDRLGMGSLGISAAFLLSAALEAVASPLLGRLSDRRGPLLPVRIALVASAIVTLLLPWPQHRLLLAALVVLAGLSFGGFWTPAMSLVASAAERRGLDQAFAFALVNLAWAPGQTAGSLGGSALANLAGDRLPYLLLCATCLLTLGLLWRFRSSS